jgi:hypothetical protein
MNIIRGYAQEGVAINQSNLNPDVSAILDVSSTEKGVLIPRMTQSQRNLIVSPANSLLIFQTTAPVGYYYYDALSSTWLPMGKTVEKIDDLTDGSNGLGVDNLFLGTFAGASNQVGGDYNVGVGIGTQTWLSTGIFNNSLGYNSLKFTTTGTRNVAIGSGALEKNTTGGHNTAIGGLALRNNLVGAYNVALGYQAGFNSTANRNVFLGYQAGFTETGSNKLHIGYTSLRSLVYGEFDNELLRVNGTLQVNDPTSTGYAFPLTDGSNNQMLTTDGAGQVSWSNVSTGSDDQNISGSVLSGTNLTIGIEGGTSQIVDLSALQDGTGTDDQNISGSVLLGTNLTIGIEGGTSQIVDLSALSPTGLEKITEGSSTGWRFIGTDPAKHGSIGNNAVDLSYSSNFSSTYGATGNNATAMGLNTIASGNKSTSLGNFSVAAGGSSLASGNHTNASGTYSVAMGNNTNAPSANEMVIGSYNTIYTPLGSSSGWSNSDRLFTIGNGLSSSLKSNALIIYKDGRMNINDAYTMPNSDGALNQVLTTDGAGNVSWSDAMDTDWSYNGTDIYNGNTGNVGIGTNAPNVSLDVDGGLALREFVSTTTFNPVSDLPVGSMNRSFVTFDNYTTDFTINSIAAGTDGKMLVLQNNTVHNMTIRNELISATAANRVRTMKNADIITSGRATITLIYSTSASRWVVLSEQDSKEWVTDGDDIYNANSGNVGIGTPTPIHPLHIYVPPLSGATYGQYMDYNMYSGTLAIGSYIRAERQISGGTTYGSFAYTDNDAGNGATYGVYGFATGSSTGMKCGVYGTTGGSGNKFAGYFAGNVFSTGSYLPSDAGLKKNVTDFGNAIAQLESIQVKEYEYIHDGDRAKMNLPKGRQIGIMAQNVEQVFPQLITANEFDLNMDPDNKEKDYKENMLHFKAVNYTGMIPVTIKAIQELKSLVDKQNDIIDAQSERAETQVLQIKDMQERLEAQQKQIEVLLKKMENL